MDTSNFENNSLEKTDLILLVEIRNCGRSSIELTNFKVSLKSSINEKLVKLKPDIYFNRNYSSGYDSQNQIVVAPGKFFFIIGLTCLELSSLNKRYLYLSKKEKKTFLIDLLRKSVLYIENKKVELDLNNIKIQNKGVYYPHDPDKPDPMKLNPVFIK